MIDPSSTQQFLRSLFGHDLLSGFSIGTSAFPPKHGRHAWHTSPDEAAACAMGEAGANNVYFRTTPVRHPPEKGRGDATVASALLGFHADIDIAHEVHTKTNLPPDETAARKILELVGVAPTILVHSGHGLQAHWLFKEPWIFGEGDLERATELVKRFGATITACAESLEFGVDTVADLARILRLPGTVNRKAQPLPVRVLEENGPRYDLSDLEAIMVELTPPRVEHIEVGGELRVIGSPLAPPSPLSPKLGFQGSDEELLDAARRAKNGPMFRALFDRGELQHHDHDASKADWHLAEKIAFWCGPDAERIDRLFRQSKLMRGKWDEIHGTGGLTYGQMTIADVLGKRTTYFSLAPSPNILRLPPTHVGRPEGTPSTTGNRPTTDLGNAERLMDRYGDSLMYCPQTDRWLVWDGRRWSDDDQGRPLYLMGLTARAILQEAEQAGDPIRRKIKALWALSSESKGKIESGVSLAATIPSLVVHSRQLDADPWLFNVNNGTIDLRTGRLRPHAPADRITKLAPVDFVPGAECPQFHSFLDRIFAGDQELIGFVQRLLGMALSGDISEQYLFIVHGVGANGKSVLIDLMMRLLGPYATLAPTTLLEDTGRSEHPTEIADLMGRRLVVASETEDGAVLKLQAVKRLSGDAELKGRFMRQDFFTFGRTHKLIMVTNNKPRVREESEAVWRRLRLVPFSVVIPPSERDLGLSDKLWGERSGILNWLVDGCRCWQEVGLGEPAAVQQATSSYRSAEDMLGRFLSECCFVDTDNDGLFVPWSALYSSFESWAEHEGEKPLTSHQLREALDKRGLVTATRWHDGKSVKGRVGVVLGSRPAMLPIE